MADVIQIRRDTSANWTSVNPTLAQGEFGYETNTGKIKIGDGSTAWNSLAYSFDFVSGVTDHGLLTGLGDDDHTQYLNTTRHSAISGNPHGTTAVQVGADPSGTAAAAVAAHEALSDPHANYETTTELNARDTANRSRANHTGTQLASTISDFASTVLGTVLSGLSLATATAVTAADSILVAIGKLQAQLNLTMKMKTSGALVSSSATVFTDITELATSLVAGKSYKCSYAIRYRSAVATTGIVMDFNASGGFVGTLSGVFKTTANADGSGCEFQAAVTALNDVTNAGAVPAINTDYLARVEIVIVCTTSGTVTPRFRSETAGTNVTVQASSLATCEEF